MLAGKSRAGRVRPPHGTQGKVPPLHEPKVADIIPTDAGVGGGGAAIVGEEALM
jgi:hypothetical protein